MSSIFLRPIPVLLIVAALFVGGWLLVARTPAPAATPYFVEIAPPVVRKDAFFRWLAPMVERENQRLEPVRRRLERLQCDRAAGRTMPARERAFLAEMAELYKTTPPGEDPGPTLSALLRRVDGVPVRLALVQAAMESGWGTGRFARDANNYFGIWTWRHEGLVPDQRTEGADHAVAVYPDAAASVRTYLFTLDVGAAYSEMRRLRAEARAAGRPPRAEDLAAGLVGYSERGQDYVEDICDLLRSNADILDAVLEGS